VRRLAKLLATEQARSATPSVNIGGVAAQARVRSVHSPSVNAVTARGIVEASANLSSTISTSEIQSLLFAGICVLAELVRSTRLVITLVLRPSSLMIALGRPRGPIGA
jgi:hypothetical protein